MSRPEEPVAQIRGARVTFPSGRDVGLPDLMVRRGEVVAVVGPSGSGKSTLLKALAGYLPHFWSSRVEGRVLAAGYDPSMAYEPVCDRVAYLPQDASSAVAMATLGEEVALSGAPEAVCRRWMTAMGVTPARRTDGSSTGELQRALLAWALASGRALVLLDEPLVPLDHEGRAALRKALDEVRGRAGVVATDTKDRFWRGWARIVHVGCAAPVGKAADEPPLPAGPKERDRRPVLSWGRLTWSSKGFRLAVPPGRIGPGEALAVVGPNGSGKSTLLRALGGVRAPDRGWVRGGPVGYLGPEPRFYLTQDTLRSSCELAGTAASRAGGGPSCTVDDVDATLDALGLAALAGEDPRTLSGGEATRAALAVVLCRRSRALVLDEPTRGLDPLSEWRVLQVLRGFIRGGGAVVVATHDRGFARGLTRSALRLGAGKASRVRLAVKGESGGGDPP